MAEPVRTARGPAYAPEADAGYELGGGADAGAIAVMGVTLVAIAGAAVQAFEARPAPVIAAPEGPIKELYADGAEADFDIADSKVYAAMQGEAIDAHVAPRPEEEVPLRPEALAGEPLQRPVPDEAAMPEAAFVVQLGAFSSAGAARARWSQLLEAQPALLADAQVEIESVEAGVQGRLYRLRTGAFLEREQASAFCARLDAVGIPCMTAQQ